VRWGRSWNSDSHVLRWRRCEIAIGRTGIEQFVRWYDRELTSYQLAPHRCGQRRKVEL